MVAIILAAFGVLVAVVVQVMALRAGMAYVRSCAAGLGLGSLAIVAAAAALIVIDRGEYLWPALSALVLFASWWFIFLNFIQASQSSIRVQILRLLLAQNPMHMSELLTRYNDHALLRLRLDRLMDGGAVVRRDG